jgi:hypothetical protein
MSSFNITIICNNEEIIYKKYNSLIKNFQKRLESKLDLIECELVHIYFMKLEVLFEIFHFQQVTLIQVLLNLFHSNFLQYLKSNLF